MAKGGVMTRSPRYLALSSHHFVDEADSLLALVATLQADHNPYCWSETVVWDTSDDSVVCILHADGRLTWMIPHLASCSR
jgi:hypothetical protein